MRGCARNRDPARPIGQVHAYGLAGQDRLGEDGVVDRARGKRLRGFGHGRSEALFAGESA
jgi:hypothetical protein